MKDIKRLSSHSAAKALLKRQKQKSNGFRLEDYLFAEQLAFVRDPSPNKVAVCSRRAGKTISCAAHLVDTSLQTPGVVSVYITLSRSNAKKIIWRELKKINRDYDLKGDENLSELSITFPNGSIIYLSGAKDTDQIEKFRGLALKLVYIDEAQSFREYIKELIDDVLSPALMDYAGTICLTGTPGATPVGYFARCAGVEKVDKFVKENEETNDSKGWSKHSWTFWDNPFIIQKSKLTHQEMLDRELKRRGVSVSDPSIQREWFGKWVLDNDSLLLHYNDSKNHYQELPALPNATKYNYILGIDLGMVDADALAVLAWSEHSKVTYLVEEVVTAGQGLTELVQQIQALQKKYDISKMVIDEGGLGKKLAEEMRRRHHIPVQAADKARKAENIALLDDALRTGQFKAKSGSKFAQDCFLVEIDREKTTPSKLVVSSRYHSDIIDAVLYGAKESPAFTYTAPKEAPKYGTREWAEAQADSMFEAAQEHFAEKAELERHFNGNYD